MAYLAKLLSSARENDELQMLFDQAGWDLSVFNENAFENIFTGFSDLVPIAEAIIESVRADKIDNATLAGLLTKLGQQVAQVTKAICELPPPPGLKPEDVALMAQDLLMVFGDNYLSFAFPRLRAGLILLNILHKELATEIVCEDGRIARKPGMRIKVNVKAFKDILTNPKSSWDQLFDDLLSDSRASESLTMFLGDVLTQVGPDIGFSVINGVQGRALGYGLLEKEKEAAKQLIILDSYIQDGAESEAGVDLRIVLGCTNDQSGNGVGLIVALSGGFDFKNEIITSKLVVDSPYILMNKNGVNVQDDSTGLSAFFSYSPQPTSDQLPLIQFGKVGSSGFFVGSCLGEAEVIIKNRYVMLEGELQLWDVALAIVPGDGDGFLQKILPKDGIRIDFDLAVGWSNKKGLYFRGGAGLETTLPINKNLFDVLLINSVYLAILAKESGISLAAATSVTLKMGPVVIAIEQMGLQAKFTFPERGGNLGPVNLAIAFKPPKGAGLVIDASAVVGAGFLEFDPDNAMYSGFVYLEIVKKISVTAVGLITTRMPDGSPGFSLLALIAVQFSPGIQLGYGFTLNGLGGLLGINRTVTVDVLRAGLRNGTLGSILFPSDPKKNIARIISDLKAVFPPAEGRFVFGPMVILGWGPNELIKLELGIILELPDPVRLLILGRLSLKLPDEKNPVVRLKLDSLGVIEFATGDVSLDAVLYDSEIKGFTITGEMALRANFGASPGFLLSVGGFHPAFKAPPGFPTLQRVAISLATGDNPRLRLAAYMAITTNTVQFGAALEIYAKAGPFSLEGQLSFDALIQFDPFGLAIGMGAMIAIKLDEAELLCLRLEMNLTGPTPWHAWGEVQFKILLVEVKIAFDVTTGESETLPPPMPVDLTERVLKALQDPTNWSTQLPLGEHPLVVFREEEKQKHQDVLVHPLAMLQVSQRVAPLNKKLYKFGNTPLIEGGQYFSLSVPGAVVNDSDYVEDWFAPAQFIEMDDNEKLAADSFEKEKAGIRFTQDGYVCGTPVTEDMGYETNPQARAGKVSAAAKVKSRSTRKPEPYTMTSELLQQVASIGAVGQSLLQKTGTSKYQDAGAQTITAPVFSINPRSYAVIGGDTAAENAAGGTTTVIDPVTGLGTTTSAVTGISGIEGLGVAASYTAAMELLRKNQTASAASQVRLKIVPFIG